MKASHDTNADNSAAKQAALDAMTAREWTQALAEWKAHWAAHPEAADHNPDDMHDRAVSHLAHISSSLGAASLSRGCLPPATQRASSRSRRVMAVSRGS